MSLNNVSACLLINLLSMFDLVPLHGLPAGNSARVAHIFGCPEQVRRIHEMGIRDGTEIEMIRSGTPCIIRTGLQTLCVRGSDLLHVLVQPGVVREQVV
jgi:ferrous iron transport protein A